MTSETLREEPTQQDRPLSLTRNPISIGGCGSSGTSLLRAMLDAHPEVACGKEMSVFDRPNTFEITLEDLAQMYDEQRFEKMDEGMPFPIVLEDGSTYFGLKKGRHGDAYHTPAETRALIDESDSVREFLNRYFTHYARKEGKQIWAEKTPGNVFFAKEFLSWYPEGRFINMVRDGRDVWLSLVKRRNFTARSALIRWIMSVEAGLKLSTHDRAYELHYEDLVADPEDELNKLCDWLDLDYAPSMLEFYEGETDNRYGYASTPVHQKSKGRWERSKDELDPTVRRTVELGLKRHLRAAGYET